MQSANPDYEKKVDKSKVQVLQQINCLKKKKIKEKKGMKGEPVD